MTDISKSATQLLKAARDGDQDALNRLFKVVYTDLHQRAQACMRSERGNHTLQPTALVHEAYMRLIDEEEPGYENRGHFLALAARTMRRILVDHARAKKAAKRGGDAARVTLDEGAFGASESNLDLVVLDEALEKLEAMDKRLGRIVEMRFFAGLSIDEIAEVLKVDPRTVKRHWKSAKTILQEQLTGGERGE